MAVNPAGESFLLVFDPVRLVLSVGIRRSGTIAET